MKKLLILLLIISPAIAYTNAENIILTYGGYNQLTINHLSSNAQLTDFTQTIYMYPQEEIIKQQLNNLTINSGRLIFNKKGDFTNSGWGFNFTIKTRRRIPRIKVSPEFPYPTINFNSSIKQYLTFGTKTDSSSELKKTADEIVNGVTNYLTAIQSISSFVNNYLTYTFTNEYTNGTRKASETLNSKKGVCDEYAVLLISLLREEGIPARYVTGYAYGNVLGLSNFGPHAWVEVYVPETGWISVDPTYGEFGWIDASHVSIIKSWNVTSDYIHTSTTGYQLSDLEVINRLPESMRTSFGSESSGFTMNSVINETRTLNAIVSVSKNKLAENDYFLLNVTISNPTRDYIPISYSIVSTSEMKLINTSNWRPVLLKPLSTVSSYTLMRTPEVGMHVIHPINVYIPMAGDYNTSVEVNPLLTPSTSLNELLMLMNNKNQLTNIELTNLTIKPNLTYGNQVNLSFNLRNSGNTPLRNVKVNVYSDLTNDSLININLIGINELQKIIIPLNVTSKGNDLIRVFVSYTNQTLIKEVNLTSVSNPSLMITYEGKKVFKNNPSFLLKIINPLSSEVKQLNLTIITPRNNLTKQFNELKSSTYNINTEFPISWLDFGVNKVLFKLSYIDNYGTVFSTTTSKNLTREGEWWELIIDSITNFLEQLFK